MKKSLILSLAALAAFAFTAFSPGKETLAIGDKMPMPNYKLTSAEGGKSLEIKSLAKEKGLLVMFSCNTCPFVLGWEDRYNDLHKIAERNGIGMVLVNSNEAKRTGDDSPSEMMAHAKKEGYTMPYLVDEKHKLADAFGAKTTPHVFLFDANNTLVYKGAVDDNFKSKSDVKEPYLQNALNQLGAGKKIEKNETPAKGCSIKRVL